MDLFLSDPFLFSTSNSSDQADLMDMEQSDLSLELGLLFPLQADNDVEPHKSPFGSDSDYSSCGNDFDPASLFFTDFGMEAGKQNVYLSSDAGLSNDSSDVNLATYPAEFIENSELSEDGKICNAPTIIAIKQTSDSIISPIPKPTPSVPTKCDTVDAVNQHDYAIPVKSILPDEPMTIIRPKIDLKRLFSKGKLFPQPKTPCSTNLTNKLVVNAKSPESETGYMTKNAIAARENRMKKKQYVQSLENTVKNLKTENVSLKKQVDKMSTSVTEMASELQYLKSVLGNVDEISGLVKGIKTLPAFQTGIRKRCRVEGQKETVVAKRCNIAKPCSFASKVFSDSSDSGSSEQPGICVHVRGSEVSLELCHHCNKQSAKLKN